MMPSRLFGSGTIAHVTCQEYHKPLRPKPAQNLRLIRVKCNDFLADNQFLLRRVFIMFQNRFSLPAFAPCDPAAITVDWVVLTAAMVGLGIGGDTGLLCKAHG